jgi:hypothetical protein
MKNLFSTIITGLLIVSLVASNPIPLEGLNALDRRDHHGQCNKPPAIHISGQMVVVDDETFGEDEIDTFIIAPFHAPLVRIAPFNPFLIVDGCTGDEVRAEIFLGAKLLTNGAVSVFGQARLFEGTDCSADELMSRTKFEQRLLPGEIFELRPSVDSSDAAYISLTLSFPDPCNEQHSPITVRMTGFMNIFDGDFLDSDFKYVDIGPDQVTLTRDVPFRPFQTVDGCADEVRVVLTLGASLITGSPDGAVMVSGDAKLFEGSDCSTTDLAEAIQVQQVLHPGRPVVHSARLGGSDSARIYLFLFASE